MRATNPVVNSCLHNSRLRCKGCECVAGCAIPLFTPMLWSRPAGHGFPSGGCDGSPAWVGRAAQRPSSEPHWGDWAEPWAICCWKNPS